MGMDIVALILFVLTIVLAFVRKINIGIVALAVGAIAVRIFGLKDKDILDGVSVSLFITLAGITLLFSIVTQTGALDLLAKKIVALAGRRIWLLPILLMFTGFMIVAMGPGGVPALAIIPPLAVAVALQTGYNPLMLTLIAISGQTAGRFSPITPEGQIIASAVAEAGYTGNVTPTIMLNVFLTQAITALIFFIIFKGYKVKAPEGGFDFNPEKFNSKQLIAFASIVVMLVLIIVFKVNIGIAALSVAAVLLLFNIADDGAVIKAMPWATIIMVLGVGALLKIVDKMGAITLMNNALASITNKATATPVMGLSAGLLSLVSSALGVVYPTMIPMCVPLGVEVGLNPAALMAAVATGGSASGISPMSTGGALIIAAIATAKGAAFTKDEQSRTFVELLLMAIVGLVILVVSCAVFYVPIANLLNP